MHRLYCDSGMAHCREPLARRSKPGGVGFVFVGKGGGGIRLIEQNQRPHCLSTETSTIKTPSRRPNPTTTHAAFPAVARPMIQRQGGPLCYRTALDLVPEPRMARREQRWHSAARTERGEGREEAWLRTRHARLAQLFPPCSSPSPLATRAKEKPCRSTHVSRTMVPRPKPSNDSNKAWSLATRVRGGA